MSRISDALFESIKKIDELYMKIEKAEQNVIDLEEKSKVSVTSMPRATDILPLFPLRRAIATMASNPVHHEP